MLRLISAADRRALDRLLDPPRVADAAIARRVAAIVSDVRRGGDRALLAYAQAVRRTGRGDWKSRRREIESGARACAGPGPARPGEGRPPHPQGGTRAAAEEHEGHRRPGARCRATRRAAREGRLLRPRRALSVALVAADDRDPGDAGGRRGSDRRAAPSGTGRARRRARGRRDAAVPPSAARMRLRRWRTGQPRSRASTRSWAPATPGLPRRRHSSRATAASISTPGRARFSSCPRRDGPTGLRRTCWRRRSTIADARAILLTSKQAAARRPSIGRWRPAPRPRGVRANRAVATGRHRPDAEPARVDRPCDGHRARTPGRGRRRTWRLRSVPRAPRSSVRGRRRRPGDYATGSNHVLPTSGAARFRGGLSAADFVRVSSVQTLTRAGFTRIAATAVTLADAEGLTAHAESMRIRLREVRRA